MRRLTHGTERGGRGGLRTLALLTFLISLLAVPASASAAEGDPFLDACLTRTAQAPCTAGTGQAGSFPIAVHPNEKWVYVGVWASGGDPDGVLLYDRNSAGKLTRRAGTSGCVTSTGSSGACGTAALLSIMWDMAIDKNGRNLYVPTQNGNLLVFDINQTTGALTQKAGGAGCFGVGAGCTALRGSSSMFTLDIDKQSANSLYVRVSEGLLSFTRNTTNGSLTQKPGVDGCVTETAVATCTDGAGLANQGFQLSVSPDGNSVYTTMQSPGGVTIFQRFSDGTLIQPSGLAGGCISSNGNSGGTAGVCINSGNASLSNSWSTLVDPSSKHVYVSGSSGMTAYSRNTITGILTQIACYVEGADSGGCLGRRGVSALKAAMLPDGSEIVAAAYNQGTIGFLRRNASTGTLTQRAGSRGCFSSSGTGGECQALAPMGGLPDVGLAANGRFVYFTNQNNAMVATLQRDFAPQCPSSTVAVPHNTAVNIGLGCTDVNGDAITLQTVQAPAAGQLGALNQSAKSVFYSPFAGFAGSDSFKYRAVARGVPSSTATVTLNVAGPAGGGGGGGAPGGGGGGGTPPPQLIPSTVTNNWLAFPAGFTKVTNLSVNNLLAGTTVRVTCKTKGKSKKKQKKGCPYKSKRFTTSGSRAKLNLLKPFKKKKIPAGTKITIAVTVPGQIGKRFQYTMRKGKIPKKSLRCISPDGKISTCS